MNQSTRISIWIVAALKVILLSYLLTTVEINLFAQMVIVPILILEALAVAAIAFEIPKRIKGNERRKSLATFFDSAHLQTVDFHHHPK